MLLKNFWVSVMGLLFFEADNGAGSGGGGDATKTDGDPQGGAAGDPKPKQENGGEKRDAAPPKNKANDEARQFRQERNALRTELEGVKGQVTTLTGELKTERDARLAAEARAIKAAQTAAALKFGLPASMAERLKGATPEEIEADAEALAKEIPKSAGTGGTGTQPGASMGNPASAPTITKEQLKNMTPEQISSLGWDTLQAVLSGNK